MKLHMLAVAVAVTSAVAAAITISTNDDINHYTSDNTRTTNITDDIDSYNNTSNTSDNAHTTNITDDIDSTNTTTTTISLPRLCSLKFVHECCSPKRHLTNPDICPICFGRGYHCRDMAQRTQQAEGSDRGNLIEGTATETHSRT